MIGRGTGPWWHDLLGLQLVSNFLSLLWWKVYGRTCGFSKDDVMSLSGVHMATQLMQERTSTGKDNREPWWADRRHISLLSGCSALVRRETAASFWRCLWVMRGKLSALQLQVVSGELHSSWESNSAGLIAPRGTTWILCQVSQACSSLFSWLYGLVPAPAPPFLH